jgi:hypothetical protein
MAISQSGTRKQSSENIVLKKIKRNRAAGFSHRSPSPSVTDKENSCSQKKEETESAVSASVTYL